MLKWGTAKRVQLRSSRQKSLDLIEIYPRSKSFTCVQSVLIWFVLFLLKIPSHLHTLTLTQTYMNATIQQQHLERKSGNCGKLYCPRVVVFSPRFPCFPANVCDSGLVLRVGGTDHLE